MFGTYLYSTYMQILSEALLTSLLSPPKVRYYTTFGFDLQRIFPVAVVLSLCYRGGP